MFGVARYFQLSQKSRDMLQQLLVPRLVKTFSAFYGTRRFIIVFTRVQPLVPILSQTNPAPPPPNPVSLRPTLIVTSNSRLCEQVNFLQVSQPKSCRHFCCPPYVSHAPTHLLLVALDTVHTALFVVVPVLSSLPVQP
jgi:hypothetical protein